MFYENSLTKLPQYSIYCINMISSLMIISHLDYVVNSVEICLSDVHFDGSYGEAKSLRSSS